MKLKKKIFLDFLIKLENLNEFEIDFEVQILELNLLN